MARYHLVAISKRAQQFVGGQGGTGDLPLPTDTGKPLRIGRANDNDVRLPADWIQISSKHCTIAFDPSQDAWMVTDLSTNGTFVNGQRIRRGAQVAARVGDRLQLSVVDPKSPDNHMEYTLQRVDDSPEAATSAVQPSPTALAAPGAGGGGGAAAATPKRKRGASASADGGGAAPATKRSKPTPGAAEGVAAAGKATPGSRAPPPSPVAVVGEGRGLGGAADAGADDIQALFKLQEYNQARAGDEGAAAALPGWPAAVAAAPFQKLARELDAARLKHEETERQLRQEAATARRSEAAAHGDAAGQVKDAGEKVRLVESELVAMRARQASLEMDLEAANQSAAAAAEEAAREQEAAVEARAGREAAEGRLKEAEAELAAAVQARREAEAARAELEGADRSSGELAARLRAAEAEGQLQKEQLEALHRELSEERRGRQAAEGQLDEAAAAAEQARRQIASLESCERLLQNDRLLVDGCLAALQRGNQRSQAANQRITQAFAELERAKAAADSIMEEQCRQCGEICTKLAASSGSHVLQSSPAPGGPPATWLAGTQEVLPPGMLSPLGEPLTAPAVRASLGLGPAPMAEGSGEAAGAEQEEEEQRQQSDRVIMPDAEVAAAAEGGQGQGQGQERAVMGGDGPSEELEGRGLAGRQLDHALPEELLVGEAGGEHGGVLEAELLEGQLEEDFEMVDVEDEGPAAAEQPAAAGGERDVAAAGFPAERDPPHGPSGQLGGAGGGAVAGFEPTAAWEEGQEVMVIEDSEAEGQREEAGQEEEQRQAVTAARALAAAAIATALAVEAQAMGHSLVGLGEEGEEEEEEGGGEAAAAVGDAAEAASEIPLAEEESPVDSNPGAAQLAPPAVAEPSLQTLSERANSGATPASQSQQQQGAEIGAGAGAKEQQWGSEGSSDQEAGEGRSRGAGAASSHENDAGQGNAAGTQDDGSVPSKVPESEPQQVDTAAAAVQGSPSTGAGF